MRAGYFAMPLHPPGADPARTMEEDLEQLVTLDRVGFEEAWIGEHFTAMWENIPCPDLFIAKALALTQTMKLGTGVSCLPNHSPLMLAQRIAQLDQMARGRFYWGVGSGGFPGDFEVVGVDPKSGEQREITRAVLDLILELWNDPKPGLYESKYWRFRIPEPQEDIGLRLHLRPYPRPPPTVALPGLPAMPDSDVTLPYLLDNIWIVGDPDTVAAKLAKLRDEVGGFGALLVIAHEWRPQAAWERSMVLLREQVLPRLAS